MKVNLTRRVRDAAGAVRYARVNYLLDGSIDPGAVVLDGQIALCTAGTFYVDWYEGKGKSRKRIKKAIGKDPEEALRIKRELEAELIMQALEKVYA